jgi:hypothetical protein
VTEQKVPGTLPRITKSVDMQGSYEPAPEGKFVVVPELPSGEHNVVTSSLGRADLHAPVLDIDIPHTLVPSSTPGHSHLYLDVEMTWAQYERLLEVLADVGIIEKGYYLASQARGFTAARLPWIKKEAS